MATKTSAGRDFQDNLLGRIMQNNQIATIYLLNRMSLRGRIMRFDPYVILLEPLDGSPAQMVYKSAVVSVSGPRKIGDQRRGPGGPRRDYAPREGGYGPREGGYGSREGGYPPREGGYRPREGGYGPREGSYGPREGGYPPRRDDFPRDEPGESRIPGGFRPPRPQQD